MHTMHEQPGLCRGCLVVAWEDDGSASPSPKIARLARVSRPSKASRFSGSCLADFNFFEAAVSHITNRLQ